MNWIYIVRRKVVETFYVEVQSEREPTRKQILAAIADPHSVKVLEETVEKKPMS